MVKSMDWKGMRDMSARLLEERTGEGVESWNRRIQEEGLDDEEALRAWLTEREGGIALCEIVSLGVRERLRPGRRDVDGARSR